MMPRVINLQIILILATILICTTSLAFAQCSSCGATQDWTASATAFLEGRPINESEPGVSGPHLARLQNTEFNSNLLNKNPTQPSNINRNSGAPSLNIDLSNVYASPNPVSSGNPIMLNAKFGTNGSKLSSINKTNNLSVSPITIYAIIKNLAGKDIGRVDLEPISGVDYAGIWNANDTEGIYDVTIFASSLNGSKTFSDVLQIGIGKSV